MVIEQVSGKLTKVEKKELFIFLLVTFGMPLLMTIPLALSCKAGKDTSIFAGVQMLYPAAGLMLAKLLGCKDTSLLPKKVFGGYLLLTLLFVLCCFAGFFVSTELAFNFLANGVSLVFLMLFLFEDQKKLRAYGLLGGEWKTSFLLLGLFLLLYLSFLYIFFALTTDAIVAGGMLFEVSKNFLPVLLSFPLSIILFSVKSMDGVSIFNRFCKKNLALLRACFSSGYCGVFGISR